jgi:PAS domain S-box-containing protein
MRRFRITEASVGDDPRVRRRGLRLAVSVFSVSLVLIGAICGGVGVVVGLSIKANNREVAQAQMNTSEMSTTLFFEQTWQQLASLLVDPLVRSAVGRLTVYAGKGESALPDPDAYGRDERAISDRFSYIAKTADRIAQIELGMADGGYVMYPPSPRMAGYDPRERPWYEAAMKSDAERAKTGARLTSDGRNLVISLVGRVRDPDGIVAGVGSISVSLADLTGIIDSTRIGRRGYLLLFQEDGVLLADPERPEYLAKAAAEIPEPAYAAMLASRGDARASRIRIGNSYYEPYIHAFGSLGFFEIALMSEEDFIDQIGPIVFALAIITIVISGLMCAVYLIVAARERVSQIKDRESYFRRAFENVKLLVAGIDAKGRIRFANDFLCEWSGYPKGSIVSRRWYDLFVPEGGGPRETVPELLEDIGVSCRIEEKAQTASGEERIVAWTKTSSYDERERVSGIMLIGEDVTEKRRQEAMMTKAVHEKELLLHEVHHRVKNNLQLISSLLALQERESPIVTRRFLKEARDRIQSISLVHECLYSANDYSSIDFGDYATQIIVSLISSFGNSMIAFRPEVEPLALTLDEAVPCGLILNEAVTNVLKYAFPQDWAGSQRIELRVGSAGDGQRFLEVRDNGIGVPSGLDASKSDTLGCTIMRLLSQQLGGSLSITSEEGTRVHVSF